MNKQSQKSCQGRAMSRCRPAQHTNSGEAVSFFGLSNIVLSNDLQFTFINFTSIFLSFIFSFLTIKYFLKYVESFSLTVFVIYRVILGIIILAFAYF